MAHNIEFREDLQKHSFVSVQEIPWHKLGTVLSEKMTAEQAFELANLNFNVALKPAQIRIGNSYYKIPNKFGIYRTDLNTPFTVVGKKYEPVQNAEAFTFFDSFIERNEAIYETAGCLGLGEKIFITAKLPDTIKLSNEDNINKYLLFSLSHDGSAQIDILFTPVRVVCNNTLQLALNHGSNRLTIRHTKSAHDHLTQAANVMGIAKQSSVKAYEAYSRMADFKMSQEDVLQFVREIYQTEQRPELSTKTANKVDVILKYYTEGPGQNLDTTSGTLWGAYNAITGYYQNVNNFRNAKTKFINFYKDGASANRIMQKAFDNATALINSKTIVSVQ